MKLIALTVGDKGSPIYNLDLPSGLNGIGSLGLQRIVSFGINLLLTIAVLLALFFVLFGGLRWILSQGDKKQLEQAQKTILYAVIGLIVVLLSFFILNLIGFAFQVPLSGN